jgi:hypothetical protein
VLERGAEIVPTLVVAGVLPTLRTVFYRLVVELILPNTQNAYRELGRRSAAARRAGAWPELADDRRSVRVPESWDSPYEAMLDAARAYRRDRTEGQRYTVVLAAEKQTMESRLWAWFAEPYGLMVTTLGGYSSEPLQREVRERVHADGRPAILLYAGDFDPSGEHIPRRFVADAGVAWRHVERVALTADQVERFDLPPQPGKAGDPRAGSFVAQHGRLMQVELEALLAREPRLLRDLYCEALTPWWDADAYTVVLERERVEREAIIARLEGWSS